jgi:uncharacterized damage-inducible protein DinB
MYLEKAVSDTLVLLYETLDKIDDAVYSNPCRELNGATIGQHYRHVIEIFDCLAKGYETGQISYDTRKRDKQLEQDRQTAKQAIKKLMSRISLREKQLQLAASYTTDNDDTEYFATTYHRELAYALEHAVHHMAIIKIGFQFIAPGLKLPDNFGVAAATLKHKNACAQ